MSDRSKRSLSPTERSGRRKRSRYDSERHSDRDKASERPKPHPRDSEGPAAVTEEARGDLPRWQGGPGEPELSEGGDFGPYSPPFGGRRGHGGRGILAQGRTGRAPFGGPAGPPGRGPGEWGGGRFPGRMGARGFGEFGGRGGDFPGRGWGRGFFPRASFPGRDRGRMLGRWGRRGSGRMDHTGTPMFGRGGRFEDSRGHPGELGPNGMRPGRGMGGRGGPGEWQGPEDHGHGAPPNATSHLSAIDPAVLERRKKSIAARLLRQVANLQLPADLVDEPVLERLADIKGGEGAGKILDGACMAAQVPMMYMHKALGADDKDRLPICQQRFDQAQAFEYCLQLYQAVPEVHISKFGHFVVAGP